MTATKTQYRYVELNQEGVPTIAGTTLKVVELIEAQQAYGWSPEAYQQNHRYLSMAQIHSALAYYWDFKQDIDAEIERRYQRYLQLRQADDEMPLARKLGK